MEGQISARPMAVIQVRRVDDSPLKRSITLIWSMQWIEGLRPEHSQIRIKAKSYITLQQLELTSVHAEYPIVNDHTQGQKVKHVGKVLPYDRGSILAHTFSVEPIGLSEQAELTSVVS